MPERQNVDRTHRWETLGVAVLLASAILLGPEWAAAQVRFEDPDRDMSLAIGGWLQPRYEFFDDLENENLSGFRLRRLRLDLSGHVFDTRLTYRLMPELAGTANLRDAYVNYAFTPALQIRGGQFTVPFQWHRMVGPRRQHFAERGEPSETFGFPTGRDMGVMLHGENAERTLGYGVGLFDGAGRNVQQSNSAGHMVSGRFSFAPLGRIPREETDFRRSQTPNLSFNVGVQTATRSEVRPWDLGRSLEDNVRADWDTVTAGAHLAWQGFSVVVDGYRRSVRPDDPAVAGYHGTGYMVSAGYAIVPSLLEVVGRYSDLRLDRHEPDTRQSQWGAGVNIYHVGHDSKVRVQYLSDRFKHSSGFGSCGTLMVEYHLQF